MAVQPANTAASDANERLFGEIEKQREVNLSRTISKGIGFGVLAGLTAVALNVVPGGTIVLLLGILTGARALDLFENVGRASALKKAGAQLTRDKNTDNLRKQARQTRQVTMAGAMGLGSWVLTAVGASLATALAPVVMPVIATVATAVVVAVAPAFAFMFGTAAALRETVKQADTIDALASGMNAAPGNDAAGPASKLSQAAAPAASFDVVSKPAAPAATDDKPAAPKPGPAAPSA